MVPPTAVIVVVKPEHMVGDPALTVVAGTVMVLVTVFTQPLALVPVTV